MHEPRESTSGDDALDTALVLVGSGATAGELDEVTEHLPADRYVLVDDEPGILAAAKAQLADRLVTVLVGHGGHAQGEDDKSYAGSELEVDDIADLRNLAPVVLREAGK